MATSANRPTALIDAQSRAIINSWDDRAMQGDLQGGSNLVYVGFARPGSLTSDPVWQIRYITYSGNQPTAIQWPQNSSGYASNDYEFVWDDRTSLTFS